MLLCYLCRRSYFDFDPLEELGLFFLDVEVAWERFRFFDDEFPRLNSIFLRV
jgi:hypothetical protein